MTYVPGGAKGEEKELLTSVGPPNAISQVFSSLKCYLIQILTSQWNPGSFPHLVLEL